MNDEDEIVPITKENISVLKNILLTMSDNLSTLSNQLKDICSNLDTFLIVYEQLKKEDEEEL